MSYIADRAETARVTGSLTEYAYRELGSDNGGVPLVLLQRLRGTMDHWDPAFLDALAAGRRVLLFDNIGIGATAGTVPDTVAGIADAAVDFITALGLDRVDLLGWSLGGFVAQAVALAHPQLVRRLVVAGSGPGGVPDSRPTDAKVLELLTAAENSVDDFLYLFFGTDPESQKKGRESLVRLLPRLSARGATVTEESWRHQLNAIIGWAGGVDSAWQRLGELELPVLVANGIHDVVLDAGDSFAMAQRLPNAVAIFYSDAGHGFLFQHPDAFAAEVLAFLSADD
ncbi:alpha/beta fold hydrolase [Mycolicibacterium sp.]|uniref:alpha/beta fold hydrolase n=1 Tax=Mycolicibacterium sp. TaxID=2320850 RepID=UPI003D145A4F